MSKPVENFYKSLRQTDYAREQELMLQRIIFAAAITHLKLRCDYKEEYVEVGESEEAVVEWITG